MVKKRFVYIIFLLLTLSIAYSQEDFSLSTTDKLSLCPCSSQGYQVFITNNDAAQRSYSVSFSGTAKDWAKAEPESFVLNPGQASYFYVYINSPCNIKGLADLNIHVAATSIQKIIKQQIIFEECYKYEVKKGNLLDLFEAQNVPFTEHEEESYDLCEGEDKAIPILLTNKESYANAYLFSLLGPEWAELNARQARLEGNSQGVLLLRLNTSKAGLGEHKIDLETVTKFGEVENRTEIKVNINKCYGLMIAIGEEEDHMCQNQKYYDIFIENDGIKQEMVNIWAEPSFVELNKSFLISPKTETVMKLKVNPQEAGEYVIRVSGNVTNTKITSYDDLKLKVYTPEECFGAAVYPVKEEIVNRYTEEYYRISIVNNGLEKAVYNLSVQAPSWIRIEPENLELKPQEKGNVNLYAYPKEEVGEGDYKIKLDYNHKDYSGSKEIAIKVKKGNPIINGIKQFFSYYKYYIYLLIILLVIFLILFNPIKKSLGSLYKKYQAYSVDKQGEKQKEEEKKVKDVEKEKKKEEKKVTTKKVKKEKKNIFSPFLIIFGVLMIIAGVFVSYIIFPPVKEFFVLYFTYIVIGLIILAIIIFFLKFYKNISNFFRGEDE